MVNIIKRIEMPNVTYRIIERNGIFKPQIKDGIWKCLGSYKTFRGADDCLKQNYAQIRRTAVLKTNGECYAITPKNGKTFSLEELQTIVGGYIEIVQTIDGWFLVVDEEGKLKRKELNPVATSISKHQWADPIVGNALYCDPNCID